MHFEGGGGGLALLSPPAREVTQLHSTTPEIKGGPFRLESGYTLRNEAGTIEVNATQSRSPGLWNATVRFVPSAVPSAGVSLEGLAVELRQSGDRGPNNEIARTATFNAQGEATFTFMLPARDTWIKVSPAAPADASKMFIFEK
jgi:hypothetical protein